MSDLGVTYLKAFTALNGRLVYTDSNEEAIEVLAAMKNLQDFEYEPKHVLERALRDCEDGIIKYLIVNTNKVIEDVQISMIIETPEYPVPRELDTDEGVFAFVYNINQTLFSELGYIFLEKIEKTYRRIG